MMEICKQFLEVGPQFEKDRPQSEEGNNLDPESLNCFFVRKSFSTAYVRR